MRNIMHRMHRCVTDRISKASNELVSTLNTKGTLMKISKEEVLYAILHTGAFLGLQFIGAVVGLILGFLIGFGSVLSLLGQAFKVVMCIAFFPNYIALMLTAGEIPWEAVALLQFICSLATVKVVKTLCSKYILEEQQSAPHLN